MKVTISKYLSYTEATKSEYAIRKGIDNTPNAEQLENMKHVAEYVFDYLREKVNGPLYASSFFRCPELNAGIGGAKNSQHTKGEAIDIDCEKFGNGNNKQIFYLVKYQLEFDQLIWEFGNDEQPDWIHVSKRRNGPNRKEVLRAYRTPNGETRYVPFESLGHEVNIKA